MTYGGVFAKSSVASCSVMALRRRIAPAVVVLVMALDELQREAVERPGTAMDGLKLVPHGDLQE
jgi:hypothetical protein